MFDRRFSHSKVGERVMVAIGVVVGLALVATAAVVGFRFVVGSEDRIDVQVVDGPTTRQVSLLAGQPAGAALVSAGVRSHDGRLLSAGTGKVLDPAEDPAELTVDGRAATRTTAVGDGAVVRIVDGTDSTEATTTKTVEVAAPPMADVLRHVQVAGRPGSTEQVVGVVSGEVLSSTVLVAPVAPQQMGGKVVALTFDDGPDPTWTDQVLALLAEKGVKATFCEVGENVGNHPELSARIVAAGHELCNHTQDHDERMRGADQARLDEEIGGGARTFADHDLPTPAYFRPPGGFLDDAIIATAEAQGEAVITWKVDTEDWRKTSNPLTVIANVRTEVEPGAIILMHDGGGDRSTTIAALGAITDELQAQGYRFVFPVMPAPSA